MHIAFLTSEYPHPKVTHAAGIGTSIKNLADALVNKGEQVTVFVYHQYTSEIIEDQGVTIHLIPKKTSLLFTWYFYRKRLQNYINSVVEIQKIDVIEAPDWTGITAFMKLKAPLVIRLHGSDAYFCKLEKRRQKFKNFVFEKLALQSASAYIAPTTFAGEETAKIFGLNRKKIKTIHNGVQLTYFENLTPKDYEEKTILYIGTIIRKKGVLKLAEIFNTILETEPNAKLKLIGGDAPDIKTGHRSTYALMQSIFSDQAKQNVEYLGKIPYSDVKAHIKKAHVCTFPSFAETLGMVTIESMALEKPIVNTSIGWAQELIDDGVNGFLVHPSDIEGYDKAILRLFKDVELSATIGRAARKKTELSFDINSIADKNIAFYNDVILKRD
ncbi:Glycosyltransferase involved in cell wall bisynthesis [Algibacter lectus]|uniref:glycosyltransferase family 4 protein n=1 Tax=Algibacter lectus TaxID=221126 RepID=UPI0008EFB0FB|nr:glycosyltransferase family 4 protein [Algibacter lectus]SFD25132.1 Glycosyltransferase involved in cell wall bisynthesis [Algibacter lectus]